MKVNKRLPAEILSGFSQALAHIPNGMATGLLAGTNPVYGLYSNLTGPAFGGLFSSSKLMIVTTTSAGALMAGQIVSSLEPGLRFSGMVMLTLLTGVAMVLIGLLRLAKFTKFISYSVMSGFLSGISVITIVSQIPGMLGIKAEGSNTLLKLFSLLTHFRQFSLQAFAVTVLTLLLLIGISKTKIRNFAQIIAIIIPSVLVFVFRWNEVSTVLDIGPIPRSLGFVPLPDIRALSPELLTGALAMAVISLVQGAGVSQSISNPDGVKPKKNQDFIAQGIGNIATSALGGIPVGGSVNATALNIASGSKTRGAGVFSGLFIILVMLVLAPFVERIVMPSLALIMAYSAYLSISPKVLRHIWSSGNSPRIASVATFLATMIFPIQLAVFLGVTLSILLNLYNQSREISLSLLTMLPDNRIRSAICPLLIHRGVTVLELNGTINFASARTLEETLPELANDEPVAVILSLIDKPQLGATFLLVLRDFNQKLQKTGSRFYITDLSREAYAELLPTYKYMMSGEIYLYQETDILYDSTRAAYQDATAWLDGLSVHEVGHS